MEVDVQIMSGAGNIFSVIDNRKYKFNDKFLQRLAPKVCSKSFSKGRTEGLLVVDYPQNLNSDLLVKFFNPDGTTGMMCGNGGRCAVGFALHRGLISNDKQNFILEFSNTFYSAIFINNQISLGFPPPNSIQKNVKIEVEGKIIEGSYVDVGSPHFVINILSNELTNSVQIKSFDILGLGKKIRYHSYFEPVGTNVDFYIPMEGKIYLRTYERGVENETGACGTGAVSTAIIAYLRNETGLPVQLVTSSEHILVVDLIGEAPNFSKLVLTGETEFLEKNLINI